MEFRELTWYIELIDAKGKAVSDSLKFRVRLKESNNVLLYTC